MGKFNTKYGHLVENHKGSASYKSYCPSQMDKFIPINLTAELILKIGECNRWIGELNALSHLIPSVDWYLAMYVRKEALLSEQIEGTQCTLDDVLYSEHSNIVSNDVKDVVNYVNALSYGIEQLNTMPICCRLLRQIHVLLMKNVRGGDKYPGEFRNTQNWIGHGGSINEAYFVPPNVEDMNNLMVDLEKFINTKDQLDPLIKTALVHYQFETIHPFLDGNGRLGRLLIILMLVNQEIVEQPTIFPSYFLKLNRDRYYEFMQSVREFGRLDDWIYFFINCLNESAKLAVKDVHKIMELHNKNEKKITQNFSNSNGLKVLDFLEQRPIVSVSNIQEEVGCSWQTASNIVNKFSNLGILKLVNVNKQRYRLFEYSDYLDIFRKGSEPL